MFLNDELVSTLVVATESRVHALPIHKARAGRNRLRLEWGAPTRRRNEDLGLVWWREADGELLSAVTLETLRFAVGAGKHLRFAVNDPEARAWRGFHDVESTGDRHWRWTNGDGRARIRAAIAEYQDCFLRIEPERSAEIEVAWNGAKLTAKDGSYAVDKRLRTGSEHEIAIRSETFVPKDSEDTRTLGVQVSAISISCQ